jgi:hypothetical protein
MQRTDDEGTRPSGSATERAFESLLRRFFPLYCLLVAAVTFGYALYDRFQLDGDAVAYMDIGDYLGARAWAGVVNAYWHPLYPALLSLGHTLRHANLTNELGAYYLVNYAIFLLEMLAVVCFTNAIVRLRKSLDASAAPGFLLHRTPLRYLGLTLIVIASQRELSLGKIRPDALLQALLLLAIAALLTHLATGRLRYAALMGLALGFAYLTKSFALVFALLCIAVLAIFRWLWLKHSPLRIGAAAGVALLCFGVVAGPYVAALSRQKLRLDFGDSGVLNYAWYVAGTQRMHLQPYMTAQFGSAEIQLKHPEREILRSPQVLSYAALPYGTYPDWFDPSFWNDQVKPHLSLRGEALRVGRSLVLLVRDLFNHPEPLVLFALLVALGARVSLRSKPAGPDATTANAFWIAPIVLGVAITGMYSMVTLEERYITVARLMIAVTLFAALRPPGSSPEARAAQSRSLRPAASAAVLLLALLAAGESLRTVLEDRRNLRVAGLHRGWYSPPVYGAEQGLQAMGVNSGDSVACVGFVACLDDPYWARLTGVRILAEVFHDGTDVYPFLANLPNRDQVVDTVRATGAKVLVADFGNARVSDTDPFFRNWRQLGATTYYALPLN